MCICIKSLDQARGLLAPGVLLLLLSAVSSDSRHASSGNLCTACIHTRSLSTSKLSCSLFSFSLFIYFFCSRSLWPFSLQHCHSHLFISPSLNHPLLCAVTPAFHYLCIVCSRSLAFFCQKFNVAPESANSRAFRVRAHQRLFHLHFACVRKRKVAHFNLYLCLSALFKGLLCAFWLECNSIQQATLLLYECCKGGQDEERMQIGDSKERE